MDDKIRDGESTTSSYMNNYTMCISVEGTAVKILASKFLIGLIEEMTAKHESFLGQPVKGWQLMETFWAIISKMQHYRSLR